jgi:hypothetical protein
MKIRLPLTAFPHQIHKSVSHDKRLIILHSERRSMKSLLFDLVQLLNQMLNSGILNAVLSSLFRKWLLVLGGM